MVPQIKVMTRNLYLGTDIDPLVGALASGNPGLIAAASTQAWNNIAATDFLNRSGALADEIAAANPDLVGLQEATRFVLATQGGPVVIDFVGILLAQLQARGAVYMPVSSIQNIAVTLPVPGIGLLDYSDSEVILARSDVLTTNSQSGQYGVFVAIPGVLEIRRSWVSVDAGIGGQMVRVISTHLETSSYPPVQEAQAAELIGIAAAAELPVVLVGDFNSGPRISGGTGTQTYPLLVDAGFIDVWSRANKRADGFTCCHAELLDNPVADFNRRIDLILVRDASRTAPQATVVANARAEVVGADAAVLGAYGLWPSDHGGVVGSFRLPPAGRNRGGSLLAGQ